MGALSFGTSSLMTWAFRSQKKIENTEAISQFRNFLLASLKSNQGWQNTVNHASNNATLACLRPNVGNCSNNVVINNFNVFDAGNRLVFQGASASGGITQDGRRCNTFNNATGNNDCPYRYNLQVVPTCQVDLGDVLTCDKPRVRIIGTLVYRPANFDDMSKNINLSGYNFEFVIDDGKKIAQLVIRQSQDGPTGGGACSPGNWVRRRLNATAPASPIVFDPSNRVVANTVDTVTLARGNYFCNISTNAFSQPNGFAIRMRSIAGDAVNRAVSNGYTEVNVASTTTGTAYFEIRANTRFVVEHFCPTGAPISTYNLGYPVGYSAFNPNIYTQISCDVTLVD